MNRLSAHDLFDCVSVTMNGPVPWKTMIPEVGPGVYVIKITGSGESAARNLTDKQRRHWCDGQDIVYIGRSKRLRRRLSDFYRHQWGNSRPHRGGQDVKLLSCDLLVFWGSTLNYASAERAMIEAFTLVVGRRPFANRMRAARLLRETGPTRLASAVWPAHTDIPRGDG